ncbi:hypothetical protein ABC502_12520 [Alkalimonas sp. NCh-2]|uniref:hypothetical protein n=1 Tax=Alkalimonas sp. NCh-2 TaxID=3144846 RepID=UPI0031F64816
MKLWQTLACAAVVSTAAHADNDVFVYLTSSSLQTQGMAMVLAGQMQQQGANVSVLLCDGAGDLALKDHESPTLKPRDVTPAQLLQQLMSGGASVEVCALYLPNKPATADALLDGVTPAQPPRIAEKMLNPAVKVFSF